MTLLKKLLFFIVLSLTVAVSAASDWHNKITQFTNDIISANSTKDSVYIWEVLDSSRDHIDLPFSKQVHASLTASLVKSGISVTDRYIDATIILTVSYMSSLEGLSLHASVASKMGKQFPGGSILLESKILPKSWNTRTLKDVAYEISGKLDRHNKIFGQTINTTMAGLSGGISEDESFISDFTVAMNEYMTEELNTLASITIKKDSRNQQQPYKLKGKFRINGNRVNLSYSLLKKVDGLVVAKVSTAFTMSSIPQGMSLYPDNKNAIKSAFDDVSIDRKIPVDLWVNHENGIYKNDDRLEVFIRPNVDAYIRVFYVMSDGVICQIQPTSPKGSSFLPAGSVHTIGDKDDDVELIITNDTIGQEVIKVFASLTPIEERFLPTRYIEGVDYACTDDGYKGLKQGMTRALKMNRIIRPVNEIKILIK